MGKLSMFNIFKKAGKNLKVGLVLGGGGARGFGHIGVLKAFEEEKIQINFICGTSVGSLVGAAFASGRSAFEIENVALNLKEKDIRLNRIPMMPSSAVGIENAAVLAMGGKRKLFSELKIPFAAVAVNLNTGKEHVFESGDVAKCVSASCAVPAIFVPVAIDEFNYVDGGLLNNIPASIAMTKKCDVIISVDINSTRGSGTDSIKMFDVLSASIRIMGTTNVKSSYEISDIIIKPDLQRFKATKIYGNIDMIAEGYNAAKKMMPQIKELLRITKPDKERIKKEKELKKNAEILRKKGLKEDRIER